VRVGDEPDEVSQPGNTENFPVALNVYGDVMFDAVKYREIRRISRLL